MNPPLISIVMCTYNGERFLEEQLFSIIAQTYKNIEIIISDDGSVDGTHEILERFMEQENIRVIFQPKNLGPVKNFDFVSRMAKGDYIAFADQDDIWHPHKIETLWSEIGDSWLIYSDSDLVNEEGTLLGKRLSGLRHMYAGNDTRGFVFNNVVWGHAMLIKHDLLDHVLPIPANIPHDIWMGFKATTLTGIKYIDEPLTLYRQHSNTVTKTVGQKSSARPLTKRFNDYIEKLQWIKIMHENERVAFQPFYQQLHHLFSLKKQGRFVWPLFYFLMKHRALLFMFSNKSMQSQVLEIRKLARGEKAWPKI